MAGIHLCMAGIRCVNLGTRDITRDARHGKLPV